MHTRTILTPLIPLALAIGATCTPTANTRYAQLRLYGAPGCYAQNMGELGVYDINKCQSLVFEGQEVVRSVLYQTSTDGCSLHVYSDPTCRLHETVPGVGDCLSGGREYRSYEVRCEL